ncbi:MAG: hypothetical protein CL916_03430, partial [Deltaproteobacteria bacterium]|nr:hypothetical protein [Deltaproteobacteria bacterium]
MNQSSATKERLLFCALELFAVHGYHGTSLRDISGAAGVNVSLISRYFQGKKGLYQSCFALLYSKIDPHKPLIFDLFTQKSFHQLIPLAYEFAKKNHNSLLLIQRSLLFEEVLQNTKNPLVGFSISLQKSYPHMSKVQIQLGLQSLLILLTRYTLMSKEELDSLFGQRASHMIIEHLCDLANHIFSQE